MKIVTPEDLSNFQDEPPIGSNGKPKKRFEVRAKMTTGELPGPHFQKDIYIDGICFDWSINEEDYHWAEQQGPAVLMAVQQDITRHFLNSLTEFVGKSITVKELDEAVKTGWI
jgi:hypothetical protein